MAEMVVRELEKDAALQTVMQHTQAVSKENTQLLRAIDCYR